MKDPPTKQNENSAEANAADSGAHIVSFGAIAVDLVFRQLLISDEQYPLSPKEFMVMYTLLERKGELVSRTELCKAIDASVDDTALENHIHRLRKKLGKHGRLLVSKRGSGYRIEAT